ncbi:MAG: hypothetical protein H3C30_13905 [Candidatus Hydrogenedentes bacterium]|nr:hypothetical protein [Candidatus Hydrogenedentota bacterium]
MGKRRPANREVRKNILIVAAGCVALGVLIVLTALANREPVFILAGQRDALKEARQNPENGVMAALNLQAQIAALGIPPLCPELVTPENATPLTGIETMTRVAAHVHPNCFCPDTDPALQEYLDKLEQALAGLPAVLQAPTFIHPDPWQQLRQSTLGSLCPELRRACWVVAFHQAKDRKDMAAAVETLRMFWTLSRHFDETGLSLGISKRQPPVVTLGEYSAFTVPFEVSLLSAIPFLARACADRPDDLLLLQQALEMERTHFSERRDKIFHAYCMALDDTLSGETTVSPENFEERVRLMWLDRQWKKESAFIRKDFTGVRDRVQSPLQEFIQWQRSEGPFRDLGNMPPLAQFISSMVHVEAMFEAARIAVAVERRIAVTGEAPEKLEELVPDLVETIPVNPLDGNPWQYARQGKDGYWISGRTTPRNLLRMNRNGWLIEVPASDSLAIPQNMRI